MEYASPPLGFEVPDWTTRPLPSREVMHGSYCRLEPIDPERHAADLFAANGVDQQGQLWTYMAYGPFATLRDYASWMRQTCLGSDPLFFAVIDLATGKAAGVASYLRMQPDIGSIEVGHLLFSPLLQRSAAATEAMYLMMRTAFELGYRRYEWKCDALNAPSRRAAQRLGFSYEGIFRQATVVKGRNRDTAWYSVIDKEWPRLQTVYQQWLDSTNFAGGRQKIGLSELTAPLLSSIG